MVSSFGSLETVVFNFYASRYAVVAAATVWVWDTLITFDEEIQLLWSRNGRFIKALYLINRYLMLIGVFLFTDALFPVTGSKVLTPFECRARFTVVTVCQLIQSIVSSTIFILRLYVVFFSRPWAQRMLIVSLALSIVALIVFHSFQLVYLIPGTFWDSFSNTCIILTYKGWPLAGTYITPIFIDSLVYLATLFHALQFSRGKIGMRTGTTNAILHTLYVEGSIYYLFMILIRLGSVLVLFLAPLALQLLFCYLSYSMSSVLTTRWFLSFRKKILESQTSSTTFNTSAGVSFRGGQKTSRSEPTDSGITSGGTVDKSDIEMGSRRSAAQSSEKPPRLVLTLPGVAY